MKTKEQKQNELEKGKKLFDGSQVVLLTDFSRVRAEDLRRLRSDLKGIGATLLVMKKRLLGVLLKEKGIAFDPKQFQSSVGAIFSTADLERASGSLYKFFSSLVPPDGAEKDLFTKKILGGYALAEKAFIDAERVLFIGKLPPREVLLAQLLGMLAAPIRSFLYVLKTKSETPTP